MSTKSNTSGAKKRPKCSRAKGGRRPSSWLALRVGDNVQDSWWAYVCGTVVKVTKSSVHIRVKNPHHLGRGWDLRNGVVRYDMQHARLYLVKTPTLSPFTPNRSPKS